MISWKALEKRCGRPSSRPGETTFLKEVVGNHRWAALVFGFIGVTIIVRPGFDEINLGIPIALLASDLFRAHKRPITVGTFVMPAVFKRAGLPALRFCLGRPWFPTTDPGCCCPIASRSGDSGKFFTVVEAEIEDRQTLPYNITRT